jgi:hypothetical protein
LKSKGFEVNDIVDSYDYTFLATKDGKQYLITRRDFFPTSMAEKLKNLGVKIHDNKIRNQDLALQGVLQSMDKILRPL